MRMLLPFSTRSRTSEACFRNSVKVTVFIAGISTKTASIVHYRTLTCNRESNADSCFALACHSERSEGSVRLGAHLVGEVKVLSRGIQRRSVTACNCAAARRGGEQQEGERPVRRITNSIRPTRYGEPADYERNPARGNPSLSGPMRQDVRRRSGDAPVVEDGMAGRPSA